jgi:retinol-binding protein 3
MYKRQLKTFCTIFLLAFGTSYLCSGQTKTNDAINIQQLIDSLTVSLSNNYVFPEKAKSIPLFLQTQLERNFYTPYLKNPQKLAEQIEHDINQVHHDPHLHIQYDPGFVARENAKPSEEEINQSKQYWKEQNYSFPKVEVLPGNIGYLPFGGFVDDIESVKPTIYSALKFLANTSAIIIDLRENQGGSPEMVSQMESYFFKEKTHMNDLINRSANDTAVFYADPAKADSLNLAMPVYILTSHKTFSAAEDFSYGMQQARRATIVGEITGGGAHPQMPFSIGQGFVASIPFARSYNPVTKTDWEGTGVIPDIKVEADKAVLKAQELIFTEQLQAAKNEKEKHKSEYYLRSLKPTKETKNIPINLLSQLTGTYPDITLYIDKNRLFSKNNYNRNVSELKLIADNLFVLEEHAQIEFFRDSRGHYSSVKIYLNDGSVFEELKK